MRTWLVLCVVCVGMCVSVQNLVSQDKAQPKPAQDDRFFSTQVGLFKLLATDTRQLITPKGGTSKTKAYILEVADYGPETFLILPGGAIKYDRDKDAFEQLVWKSPEGCFLRYPFTWQGKKYYPIEYISPDKRTANNQQIRVFRGVARCDETKQNEWRYIPYQALSKEKENAWTIQGWQVKNDQLLFHLIENHDRESGKVREVILTKDEKFLESF